MSNQVSRIQIGNKIGEGHFGEVFLAEDEVHGDVAVKRLSRMEIDPETGQRETDEKWEKRREGLVKEAQFLAKATHPNIAQVHYAVRGDDGESVQFVMALCRAGSLSGPYKRGPMQTKAVRKIATEVSFGLQALHQRGMIHRDIKPANILLDDRGCARISDFGLVTDEIVEGYARRGGYLDHLAIEAWYDPLTSVKTDIWAFGMTLYRLLHGHTWYSRMARPATEIPSGGFATKLKWLPHIPDRWRRFIRQTMNDDTERRYGSCESVIRGLALLPVSNWDCDVAEKSVTWKRSTKGRIHHVLWSQDAPRSHSWRAWSEPMGTGRKMSIGGSQGNLAPSKCVRELEDFFARQR
ncbi:serine/threonine-protein kinase [Jiella mangrovi]|uniref:Serine/threonine protein kinase n=1 Tax=Jiella mangrovi TaxID=2821407 RepID=A0ABS4BG75_9HYPH|nr:serine/threonine-protein kinase [Jiella mangrovi]MBP0615761.1 serine/threonine protein kinase [Jiella mangrovi]